MEYDHQLLKNTRLAQGISTDKLAFDLCLSERQIDSIENNTPDFFYSTELKLASVKKCAQALGLDLKIVLRHPEVISTEFINSSVEGHAPIPSQENKMEELASDKVSMMPRQTHSKRIESQNLADHDVIRHAHVYPRLGPTSLWDTAAAHVILKEAGGDIKDLKGKTLSYADPSQVLNPFFIASS